MAEAGRRLAAIMFTDIIGYTSFSQQNESLALGLLEEHRKLVRPLFPKHHGREIKTMGDAFLVEFASALEAVRCAFDIQQSMHESNAIRPPQSRMLLRIGIHVGDVVLGAEGIHGDAVNIASRIEPIAEPGGICISEQVYDLVRNKFEFPIVALGRHELKNVQQPMKVYKIVLPWETKEEPPESSLDRRRIAVMPFTNISPDSKDEYFADGMTEEIISTLSRIGGLKVISRTSVMRYKGTGKSIDEIATELNVGSILEGSVRKASDDLRISAQLIDARNDEHLWSQDYDKKLENVFAIQREIAQNVAEALSVKLLSSEKGDLARIPTKSTQAYQLYLKGRYYWNERSKVGNDKAVAFFEEAVKLDPEYAQAYAGLADCYTVRADYGWLRPREAYPKAKQYAMKAIEIDSRIAEPHASLGLIHGHYEWRWREAEEEFGKAIELKPSYSTAHHWYGMFLFFVGRPSEAYGQIMQATEFDPLSRAIGLSLAHLLVIVGRRGEAIEQCQRVIEDNPEYADAHRSLGFMLYMDSKTDEAIEEVRKAVAISGEDAFMKGELASLLGLVGRREEATRVLEELQKLSRVAYVPRVEIAQVLLGLGRTDEAYDYLEKVDEDRSSRFLFFSVWPWYSRFRKDPRWASIEKRMGLPARTTATDQAWRSPGALEPTPGFEFKSERSKAIFDRLALDFLRDYMVLNYMEGKSGWRTIVEIARETGIPVSSLYARGRGGATPLRELSTRGLVELKLSPGERGRGGEVTRVRVAYEKEPVREYVNLLAKKVAKKGGQ